MKLLLAILLLTTLLTVDAHYYGVDYTNQSQLFSNYDDYGNRISSIANIKNYTQFISVVPNLCSVHKSNYIFSLGDNTFSVYNGNVVHIHQVPANIIAVNNLYILTTENKIYNLDGNYMRDYNFPFQRIYGFYSTFMRYYNSAYYIEKDQLKCIPGDATIIKAFLIQRQAVIMAVYQNKVMRYIFDPMTDSCTSYEVAGLSSLVAVGYYEEGKSWYYHTGKQLYTGFDHTGAILINKNASSINCMMVAQ